MTSHAQNVLGHACIFMHMLGVYAQTAANSVTLTDHVESPGTDAVVVFMADPAVSENTCLATG